MVFCLRLACILCRTRDDSAIPELRLTLTDHEISVELAGEWQVAHPLTLADLRQEIQHLRSIDLQLVIDAKVRHDGQA